MVFRLWTPYKIRGDSNFSTLKSRGKTLTGEMAAIIGWYGPLIDLCKASSYTGDFVQIVAFVHQFTPIQVVLFFRIDGIFLRFLLVKGVGGVDGF